MNSAVSFSSRSAASATDLFMRAEAAPTLRLKSFMQVPRTFERENYHALLANARLRHYFVLRSRGQPQASRGTPLDIGLMSNCTAMFEFDAVLLDRVATTPLHVFIWGERICRGARSEERRVGKECRSRWSP